MSAQSTHIIPYKFQTDFGGSSQAVVPPPAKRRPPGEAYVRPGQPSAGATGFLPGGKAFPCQDVLTRPGHRGRSLCSLEEINPYRFIF